MKEYKFIEIYELFDKAGYKELFNEILCLAKNTSWDFSSKELIEAWFNLDEGLSWKEFKLGYNVFQIMKKELLKKDKVIK